MSQIVSSRITKSKFCADAQITPHLHLHLECWHAYYHFVRPHESLGQKVPGLYSPGGSVDRTAADREETAPVATLACFGLKKPVEIISRTGWGLNKLSESGCWEPENSVRVVTLTQCGATLSPGLSKGGCSGLLSLSPTFIWSTTTRFRVVVRIGKGLRRGSS